MKKFSMMIMLFFLAISFVTSQAAQREKESSFFSRFSSKKNFDSVAFEKAQSIEELITQWLIFCNTIKFDSKKIEPNDLKLINQKIAKRLAEFYSHSTGKQDFDKMEEFRKTSAHLFKNKTYQKLSDKKQSFVQVAWRQVEQALIDYCSQKRIGNPKGFYGKELGETIHKTDLTDFFNGRSFE